MSTLPPARTAPPRRVIYWPALPLAAALSAGVCTDRWWDVPLVVWLIGLAAGVVIWFVGRGRSEIAGCLLLLAAVAAWGGALHHVHWNLTRTSELSLSLQTERQPVALRALVSDFPRRRPAERSASAYERPIPTQWKVPLQIREVRDGSQWRPATGNAEIYVEGEIVEPRPGQVVVLFAQASLPAAALNPGEFDFGRWARGQRRRIVLRAGFPECLQVVSGQEESLLWMPWLTLRQGAAETLARAIPNSLLGLAETIFLGRRERLPDATDEAFRQTGTVHLLALSGLHLGILAFLTFRFLRWLPGPVWLPGAGLLVLTVLYLTLVDARPPIIRASILVMVFCGGWLMFRQIQFGNSLAVAWIVVICWNPSEIFQAGTQLSFLAVAVLGWLATASKRLGRTDPLQDLIDATRPWPIKLLKRARGWAIESLIASAVVWVVTAPLVLYHFHTLSPWTVVLSPVLLIPMGLSLLGIVLVLAVAPVAPAVAQFVSTLVRGPLWFLEVAVEQTQQHAGFTWWTPGPAWGWVIGFYGLVALGGGLYALRRWPLRWVLALVALWCSLGFGWGLYQDYLRQTRTELVCTFVAVGHGTAVLVELPGGQNLLYDCGRLGAPQRATQSLSAVLWSKGISHLDAILISHADADHFNGIPGLLERFSVGRVYVSDLMQRLPSPLGEVLLEDLATQGVAVHPLSAGRNLRVHPEVQLTILHPTRSGVLGSDNANSLVLLVEYAGRRILLPGDLESPGTEAVTLEEPIRCDVVMAPHHGSRSSNPEAFYAWCQPQWIVVSSGSRETVVVPPPTEQKRSRGWLNTARQGLVEVRVGREGQRLQVRSFLEDKVK